jgi:hypothetical protein
MLVGHPPTLLRQYEIWAAFTASSTGMSADPLDFCARKLRRYLGGFPNFGGGLGAVWLNPGFG